MVCNDRSLKQLKKHCDIWFVTCDGEIHDNSDQIAMENVFKKRKTKVISQNNVFELRFH